MNLSGPPVARFVPGAGLSSGLGDTVENSSILASGKISLDLTAPTAAALSTVSPSSSPTNVTPDLLASMVTVDLMPNMRVPEDFGTLGTVAANEQYLSYAAQIVPAYSGRARVMITMEWEFANAKWPSGTVASEADFKTYVGRNAFCVPFVAGWNNTSFNFGNPNVNTILTNGASTYRTTGPEVLSTFLGHGSWEIELSQYSAGSRFVNVGLQYFQTFGNVTFPSRVHVYYTVVGEDGRDDTYNLPQARLVDGTNLLFNAGGLPALLYAPGTLLGDFSATKFDKVNTVQIWNGTDNSITADVRFQTGAQSISGYELLADGGLA